MNSSLLLEIGVEELPAVPFLKEYPNIEKKYSNVLEKYNLSSRAEFFYTPRRLVFIHKEFKAVGDDEIEDIFGPPLKIAYDDNGVATKAALGFAKKCGVDIDSITTKSKDGKDVLYFKKISKGKKNSELMSSIVEEFILSLSFGKSMRWDSGHKFIRPIRWITAIFGGEVIKFDCFGVSSSNETYSHRSISYESIKIKNVDDYLQKASSLGIVLQQDKRREIILDRFLDLQEQAGIEIDIDEELLGHIVAITENPNPILGSFDKEFLELPKEVITISMKEHQKYFTVTKNGKITNKFVVVSNSISKNSDEIRDGNERVLRARLKDAMFFFNNDKKRGLVNDGLEKIVFVDSLGTLKDKLQRETAIALNFADRFSENREEIKEAMSLTKADLLSEMVYEFTDLQGMMGYYYALLENRDSKIALAIKEQYLPLGKDSNIPSSVFSSIVAMSNKLDSIISLFSIGKIPSGTKDPYALRRNAIGIIKISIANNLSFDLLSLLGELKDSYNKIDIASIDSFFCERLYQIFEVNPSIITAVLKNESRNFVDIKSRVKLLDKISKGKNFKEHISTFKRVANIVKDVDFSNIVVDENLFNNQYEKNLYSEFSKIRDKIDSSYEDKLDELLSLKEPLDSFFLNVMVNDKQDNIKANRKNLIADIYIEFLKIADIKDITI
jgi:glycyl-tRNA synthetase beta chain